MALGRSVIEYGGYYKGSVASELVDWLLNWDYTKFYASDKLLAMIVRKPCKSNSGVILSTTICSQHFQPVTPPIAFPNR
jgi:hypothetical protein